MRRLHPASRPPFRQRSWAWVILSVALGLLAVPLPASAAPPAPISAPAAPTSPSDVEPGYQGYTLSQLDAMLQHGDPKQRLSALLAIRQAGATAIPVFLWAFEDEDAAVRIAAVKSFGTLGTASEPAVPAMAHLLLNDPVPAVRNAVIHTLGLLGPLAAASVPALRQIQRTGDITTRVNVSQALERILGGSR